MREGFWVIFLVSAHEFRGSRSLCHPGAKCSSWPNSSIASSSLLNSARRSPSPGTPAVMRERRRPSSPSSSSRRPPASGERAHTPLARWLCSGSLSAAADGETADGAAAVDDLEKTSATQQHTAAAAGRILRSASRGMVAVLERSKRQEKRGVARGDGSVPCRNRRADSAAYRNLKGTMVVASFFSNHRNKIVIM